MDIIHLIAYTYSYSTKDKYTWILWIMRTCLSMTAYSTNERKTRSIHASSQTLTLHRIFFFKLLFCFLLQTILLKINLFAKPNQTPLSSTSAAIIFLQIHYYLPPLLSLHLTLGFEPWKFHDIIFQHRNGISKAVISIRTLLENYAHVVELNMLTRTRQRVTRRTILAGTMSGGTKKATQDMVTNMAEGR